MESHVDEQLLADANARLKAARIRVTIRCRGEALYLRATLPPKPGSRRVKPGQYDLKTGLPLSRDGLRRAEAEAQHLGSTLALKQFDWSDWLDEKPPEEREIREWIGEFKQHYMSTHSLSETTWARHWQTVYNALPQDGMLMPEVLVATAVDTLPNTRKRREFCLKLQKLADFAEIELD